MNTAKVAPFVRTALVLFVLVLSSSCAGDGASSEPSGADVDIDLREDPADDVADDVSDTARSDDPDSAGGDAADGRDALDTSEDVQASAACGNGIFEPGEFCDDGNLEPGDGCGPDCRREQFCGDGVRDEGELCDDGDNLSGDGCRSDCQSIETCGNGTVDFAVGEVCDRLERCVSCAEVPACGDGTQSEAEECDDGGVESFDGCSAACEREHAVIVNSLALAPVGQGCDLNGDAAPDNAFARALGPLAALVNPLITEELSASSHRILWVPQGLDDATGANDPDFRIAWLTGEDADDDPDNDFDGRGVFSVNPSQVTDAGVPVIALQSQVVDRALAAGPEDIPLLTEESLPLELRSGRILGTTLADGGALHGIDDGMICGGLDMPLLVEAGALTQGRLLSSPPCDGGDPAQLVDILLAGGDVEVDLGGATLPLRFEPTPPDVDLDGDGLEGFEFAAGDDCQSVIVACVDGDGRRVEGRDCIYDPAIADGYSTAFLFTAIDATVLGVRR